MQLTRYTDYSLRVLIYLAVHRDATVTTEQVARAYAISAFHLAKVVVHLVEGGYIESTRGRGGGMRLALPADEIVIGDVVRFSEGSLALVECFDQESSACCIEPACGLARVLEEATRAFLAVLDRYTLADAVRRRSRLAQLLQITAPSRAQRR
jgi:Rrf2 family nitric oxide-sensitive transcriptional repressor